MLPANKILNRKPVEAVCLKTANHRKSPQINRKSTANHRKSA